MDQTARIKIKRRVNLMGALRAFTIYVDEKKMATVGNGKEVEFEIASGRHGIDVLGGFWARSKIIDLDLAQGETMTFECGVQGKMLYPLFAVSFVCVFLGTSLRHLPGGRTVALAVALICLIYFLVVTVITFQRGTVYYLKKLDN
jgi:hypothetical protein